MLRQEQIQIAMTTQPGSPRKGANLVQIRLTGVDGKPLEGAQVTATFFMPAMPAMGMAAMHTSTSLAARGQGVYEGSVQLDSGGTWQVTDHRATRGQDDRDQTTERHRNGRHVMIARHHRMVCAQSVSCFHGSHSAGGRRRLVARRVPLDALPDISDVQVIIHTEWAGRAA